MPRLQFVSQTQHSDGYSLQLWCTVYWHCLHSLWSRVCEVVQCPSICPSICPQQQIHWCRFAAWAWLAGDISRLLQVSNNNNNSHDNVYGAVIMTTVIARVHPVHLMNVDWAPGGRQPSDQAKWLGLWVRRKLAAIVHIHRRHCYYYSARKLILILPSHEGWKAEVSK